MNYVVKGEVKEGWGRARRLGFPTYNVHHDNLPPKGVYAARVTIGKKEYKAVAFVDERRQIIEFHVLDMAKPPRIAFLSAVLKSFIRPPQAFADDDELIRALRNDIFVTKEILH